MKKVLTSMQLRVVLLPLLGALGAVCAMVWPMGYDTFCRGLTGVML